MFTSPYRITIEHSQLRAPTVGEVQVQTLFSAISPGTELLLYRGQMPSDIPLDESIPSLQRSLKYPLKYGYSTVGQVIGVGPGQPSFNLGDLVFSFHPHESSFVCDTNELIKVPSGIPPEDAVFLANLETAINLIMDGQPSIGEQVAILGQGIVGLMLTALISRIPIASLVTVDRHPNRRKMSVDLGATATFEPNSHNHISEALQGNGEYQGADLCFEVSGVPATLESAVKLTGYNGRIVIGSWYGTKLAEINLGGSFHRSRIKIVSSQVSTIGPEWSGRWSKVRRLNFAWQMIKAITPSRLITHTIDIEQAANAYAILDQEPETALQILLSYKT